jgi:hypothetical protein
MTATLASLIIYDRNLSVNYVWVVYNLPFEADHWSFVVKWLLWMIGKWVNPMGWRKSCGLQFPCFGGLQTVFRSNLGFRNGLTVPARTFFCVELGKYNFDSFNCVFILLLKPKIMIFLHGLSRKFIFLLEASTDIKNSRTVLFLFLIRCIMLRRSINCVNYIAFDGVRWSRITVSEMVMNYSLKLNFLSCFTVGYTILTQRIQLGLISVHLYIIPLYIFVPIQKTIWYSSTEYLTCNVRLPFTFRLSFPILRGFTFLIFNCYIHIIQLNCR